jgi:hypothetical protein
MRAALFCLLLSACATLAPEGSRHSARAIFDAYLIAHGMVKSYDERPDADPAISQQLATLDIRASRALINLGSGQRSRGHRPGGCRADGLRRSANQSAPLSRRPAPGLTACPCRAR